MIYIIRHSLTELNKCHVLQGRSDHPLNAQGIAQAKAAASGLRERGMIFDRVFPAHWFGRFRRPESSPRMSWQRRMTA